MNNDQPNGNLAYLDYLNELKQGPGFSPALLIFSSTVQKLIRSKYPSMPAISAAPPVR